NELNKLDWRGRMVLKAIAEGENSWSTIRRYVEEKRGITIPKSSLTRTIRKLEKLSIIENYRFLDPVYREASKRLR
ncbi:MAG: ATP-binding protein, partial [archaeon GB-1845-036]|nr:ATP-binding protein [Candidatus Culexmicrobium thermophilum]